MAHAMDTNQSSMLSEAYENKKAQVEDKRLALKYFTFMVEQLQPRIRN